MAADKARTLHGSIDRYMLFVYIFTQEEMHGYRLPQPTRDISPPSTTRFQMQLRDWPSMQYNTMLSMTVYYLLIFSTHRCFFTITHPRALSLMPAIGISFLFALSVG